MKNTLASLKVNCERQRKIEGTVQRDEVLDDRSRVSGVIDVCGYSGRRVFPN
jgi:hypothetical protein